MGQLVSRSFSDTLRLVRDMWPVLLMFAGIALVSALASGFGARMVGTTLGRMVLETLISVGTAWVSAPYGVALFRFLLLGERQIWPEKLRRTPEVRSFFLWSAIFAFIYLVPGIVALPFSSDASEQGVNIIPIVISLATAYFSIRVITLLPNAALGHPTSIPLAFAETGRRHWFVLGAFFVLTVLSVAIILAFTVPVAFLGNRLLLPFIMALGAGLVLLLGLSMTTNLYRLLVPDFDQSAGIGPS